jgi:predicted RNase H-like HicB family nuclease
MKKIALSNVVWKEGKFFVSLCLNNDISSFGTTKVSALKNLKEALDLYYDDFPAPDLQIEIKKPELVQSVYQFQPKYAKIFAE